MIELWHLPFLFATGFIAGLVDAIAGGGGLITLPVLLSFGFAPQEALGTNKLQATFGSGSASWHYAQAKTMRLADCKHGFTFSLIGAALGTLIVQRLDSGFLRVFIPILLIAVALIILFKPQLGEKDIHPRMPQNLFYTVFGLLLGFYDGFFGPGTGTFWTMAFLLFAGFNLTKATAHTKVMNLGSNFGSLVFFLIAGTVHFAAGLTMGAGQLLGARIGSRIVIKRGTKFIRPVFISVVIALTLKILFDAYRK